MPGAEDDILRTLEALGLAWDGPVVRQRERTARYEEALAALRRAGLAYRCRCSRREIADSGRARHRRHRLSRHLPAAPAIPDGAPAADRFLVPGEAIAFDDRVQGRLSQRLDAEVGDFVVHRRDGLFAYQLAVVVDDADLGVTDVVRGADLLDSTPRQIALQRALGFATPRYLHVPVATRGGEKLSKQTLAPAVDAAAGGPAALRAALAFLGQARPGRPARPPRSSPHAVRGWDPARIPPAGRARK